MNPSNVISTAAAAVPAAESANTYDIMHVSGPMMVWTWVTFLLVAVVLYKVAWKPILSALEQRERRIRRSLEDAEKARLAAADADARRDAIVGEARASAQSLIEEGRAEAVANAQRAEHKSRAEVRLVMANAQRDITQAQEQARRQLTADTAALAVELAAKVVREQMRDPARQKALTEQLIRELHT